MKFRLKKDWYIDNFFDKVKIYDEGQIFTPNEDGLNDFLIKEVEKQPK